MNTSNEEGCVKGGNLHQHRIRSILVVDNDNLILSFMEDLLKREGYAIMTAPDGLVALDILKVRTPHAIFLDLVMPGIDGKTLCRIIRKMERCKDVYITLLSAALADETINITELGANACMPRGPLPRWDKTSFFSSATLTSHRPDAHAVKYSASKMFTPGPWSASCFPLGNILAGSWGKFPKDSWN